jgi:hypothetical protein
MLQRYQAQPAKKRLSNKIIAGLAAFLTTGVITVSGFAAATPMNNKPKTNVDCKKANMSVQERKECEKEVAASVHAQQTVHNGQSNSLGNGHGYGGVSVGTNINLNLNNSNNNVIQVIVNILR